jgi:hypothetical protein
MAIQLAGDTPFTTDLIKLKSATVLAAHAVDAARWRESTPMNSTPMVRRDPPS